MFKIVTSNLINSTFYLNIVACPSQSPTIPCAYLYSTTYDNHKLLRFSHRRIVGLYGCRFLSKSCRQYKSLSITTILFKTCVEVQQYIFPYGRIVVGRYWYDRIPILKIAGNRKYIGTENYFLIGDSDPSLLLSENNDILYSHCTTYSSLQPMSN